MITDEQLAQAIAAVDQARQNLEQSTRDLKAEQERITSLEVKREQLPYDQAVISSHIDDEARARLSLEVASRMVERAKAELDKAVAEQKQLVWQHWHDQLEAKSAAIVDDYENEYEAPLKKLLAYLDRVKEFSDDAYAFYWDNHGRTKMPARLGFAQPLSVLNWLRFNEILITGRNGVQAWPRARPNLPSSETTLNQTESAANSNSLSA